MPGITLNSSVDPLDTLELQIEELERRIIGNAEVKETDASVAESLVHTVSTMNNAVSHFDSIKNLFDRIEELEPFLDPTYEDFLTDTATKTKIIVESESELKQLLTQLKRLHEINTSLNSDQLKHVPTLIDQLRSLGELAIKTQEECNSIEKKVDELMSTYNLVIHTMTKAFIQFDSVVSEMEESAQTKRISD